MTQGGHPSLGAWVLRQALTDRHDLKTVLQEANEPFLWPEYDWEKSGFTGNTTVANNVTNQAMVLVMPPVQETQPPPASPR